MNRRLLCILAGILLWAEAMMAQQVLIPKEIYVGDRAQLRYMFQSSIDFFSFSHEKSDSTLSFDINSPVFLAQADRCSVQEAVLQRVGITYTLLITFIPWKPGEIDFAPFNVSELCGGGEDAPAYELDLSPVLVSSLVEKTGVNSLRAPLAPFLLPGTNYVLWSLIIAAILFLCLMGFIIARFPSIMIFIMAIRERIGYYRNASRTKKSLSQLGKTDCTDAQFAQDWQRIMRSYLEYRFHTAFASVTGHRIIEVICLATGNMLDVEQENAVMSLQSLFMRTDYIRYAANSIDSRRLPASEHEAQFLQGERQDIIGLSCENIAAFEMQNKEVKNLGRI